MRGLFLLNIFSRPVRRNINLQQLQTVANLSHLLAFDPKYQNSPTLACQDEVIKEVALIFFVLLTHYIFQFQMTHSCSRGKYHINYLHTDPSKLFAFLCQLYIHYQHQVPLHQATRSHNHKVHKLLTLLMHRLA